MPLPGIIAELRQSTSELDATDLNGLVSIQEQLLSAMELIDPDHTQAGSMLEQAADIVEQIVLRDIEDAQAGLRFISETVEYLGTVIETIGFDSSEHTAARTGSQAKDSTEPEPNDAPIAFDEQALRDENLKEFISESLDHLLNAEAALLKLDDEPANTELIHSVFRCFHTIKGCAGFLNLAPIVELSHSAESLLDKLRQSLISLTPECVSLLLDTSDMIGRLLGALENENTPPPADDLARLTSMLDHATSGGMLVSTPPSRPDAVKPIGTILRDLGHVTEEQIYEALESKQANSTRLLEQLTEAGFENAAAIEHAVASTEMTIPEVRQVLQRMGVHDPDQLDEAIEAQLKSRKKLGQLLDLKEDELVQSLRVQREQERETPRGQSASRVKALGSVREVSKTSRQKSKGADIGSHCANPRSEQTVRVSTSRMDELIELVTELVCAHQTSSASDSSHAEQLQHTRDEQDHLGTKLRELQELALSMRMVSLASTYQRMARLVRDLSSRSGKPIRLVLQGEHTQLDRVVIESIADPLMHMIRNACDHAIETPTERLEAGKPQVATLTLRASHQSGAVVIEVEDDGRGLDREKILSTARKNNIIPPSTDLSRIPDHKVYNMIFLPGFSTAEQITDISGRGVGMDVVRRNIESLRGSAQIRSIPGRGTTFVMRVPLTMAIINATVVRAGSHQYVIPTLAIERCVRPAPDDVYTVFESGQMVRDRDSFLPVYRLNRVLGLPDGHDERDQMLLLIMSTAQSRFSLVVDEVLGHQQVIIRSLGKSVSESDSHVIAGGTILTDGSVAPLIDVEGLVCLATRVTRAA